METRLKKLNNETPCCHWPAGDGDEPTNALPMFLVAKQPDDGQVVKEGLLRISLSGFCAKRSNISSVSHLRETLCVCSASERLQDTAEIVLLKRAP